MAGSVFRFLAGMCLLITFVHSKVVFCGVNVLSYDEICGERNRV